MDLTYPPKPIYHAQKPPGFDHATEDRMNTDAPNGTEGCGEPVLPESLRN